MSPLRMLKFHRCFVGMMILSTAVSVTMPMAAATIVSTSISPVTITSGAVVTPSVIPTGFVMTVPVSLMIVTAIDRAIRVAVSIIMPMVVKGQNRNRQAQEETNTQADIACIAGLGKKTHRQSENCRNNDGLNVFHNLTSFLSTCG